MAAILRDRINDLLTANADLEREVARLRYADAGEYFFKLNLIISCVFVFVFVFGKVEMYIVGIYAGKVFF